MVSSCYGQPAGYCVGLLLLDESSLLEAEKEERCFNVLDARSAYESDCITLHQPIKVRIEGEIMTRPLAN